ncbi:hypothetical protein BGX26_012312 [Mortierella sp. AD094]|nr:hypothetical protein BGX26_012312 [Mortierella sp. AD094]
MSDNNIRFDTICADFEDISRSELEGTISRILGSQYLQQVPDNRTRKLVKGGVLGAFFRPVISLHVQTYMSEEALRTIGVEDMVVVGESMDDPESTRLPLLINGFRVFVLRSPSKSHFAHLNILGEDFIHASRADVFFGGDKLRFEIAFP